MDSHSPSDIRNFAIVGHASAGKTVLAEAMLACSGVLGRMGRITEGTTVSDYHVSEKQRQISTQASLLHTEWLGKKLNIIDTPGYPDFLGEALGALCAADFALVVTHVQHGIGAGAGAERVWDRATDLGIPKVLVVNAMDKPNAHFEDALAGARERFGHRVFPLNIPMNPGPGFNQALDVLRSDIVTYDTTGRGKFHETPVTGEAKERVERLHRELIELIAESDDTLLAKFFDQGGLSEAELRAGIHAAVRGEFFIPLLCISAETDIGVARLLDFIAKYGPSPADRKKPAVSGGNGAETAVAIDDPSPVAQVFKTLNEEHFGELSLFRVYSGEVAAGMELINASRNATERIGQIYTLNGRHREAVGRLTAGDIGAVVKLKGTHTGDTLCAAARTVKLPPIEYPRPCIHAALQLKTKGEEDKVAAGLAALHDEDPAFAFRVDSELRQTIIAAQGELHLEVVADRLRRRFNVHCDLVPPRVPFRETINARAEHIYRHKKQTGGAGQFAEVALRIAPAARDSGIAFGESLSGQCVDRVFVASVERGVRNACAEGIVAGYRVTDVQVDFFDGKMHPVDSNDISFQVAGYWAFKEAFQKARPCLLEPIHAVEARIPEDCVGKVMGDLSSRRGRILGIDVDGRFQKIRAEVPARELDRYASQLRSLTGGRGAHEESFSRYEEMPRELERQVIEAAKERRAGR
jgi:elongation factor G